jgi:hypothetical protein
VDVRFLNSAILVSAFLFLSGCTADGRDGESSTAISAAGQEGDRKALASHAVDLLQEDMTEAEVAAALEVTHIDEESFRFTGSLAGVRYICRGRRFPSEYIDCQFFWFSSGEIRESGEHVRTSDEVLKLRNWSRVQDWGTILTLDMKKLEPDFPARRAEEWKALMRKVDSIRNDE